MENKVVDPFAAILGGSSEPEPIRKASTTNKAKWVDLEEMHQLLAEGMMRFGQEVLSVENTIKNAGIVIKDQKITALRKTIADDLSRFTEEALLIRQQHSHRNGYVNGTEELRVYMEIYEKYKSALSFFNGVMQQHTIALTEISLYLQELMMKQKQQGENNG